MNPSIEPLGDSAGIVAWRLLDDSAAWRAVQNAMDFFDCNRIEGIVAVAPAFQSLTIYYQSDRLAWEEVEKWIVENLRRMPTAVEHIRRQQQIPVCYDPEFALDLTSVAAAHNLSTEDVIRMHSSVTYVVQMIGFSPGFPYLAGLASQLHTPRRASPRTHVPAGSVAIGGAQTGIYPRNSPGGWNVIGRTPVQLFDPLRDPPCLLRSGDVIQFVPIDRQQFDNSTKRT